MYQIPCSNCPQTYIGQTGQTLGQRLKEHKKAVKDKNIITSALEEQTSDRPHHRLVPNRNFRNKFNQNTSRRCLLESWMIQKEPQTLNRELEHYPPHTNNHYNIHCIFIIIFTSFYFPFYYSHIISSSPVTTCIKSTYTICIPKKLKNTAVSCQNVWC